MRQDLHTANRKNRYDGRAGFYEQARPSYPQAIVDFLRAENFLTEEMVIADMGCGTGKLAQLWLKNGYTVYGIEPADAMRASAEQLFAGYPGSRVIEARAEATTLATGSVDFVSAGQAFHWFDYARAKPEFQRILRNPRKLVTIDNRPTEDSHWQHIQRKLRKISQDSLVQDLKTHNSTEKRIAFFDTCHFHTLPNSQHLTYEELLGRALSLSNQPLPGESGHAAMAADLRAYFERHESGGKLTLTYETRIYYGIL
jgi:SAM-dependent methyltransferase